jgi:small-conductance mechanosensitive channel
MEFIGKFLGLPEVEFSFIGLIVSSFIAYLFLIILPNYLAKLTFPKFRDKLQHVYFKPALMSFVIYYASKACVLAVELIIHNGSTGGMKDLLFYADTFLIAIIHVTITVIAYRFFKWQKNMVTYSRSVKQINKTTINTMLRLAEIAIYLVVGITFLSNIGVDTNAIVATLGGASVAGAAAVGFASKDSIANLFGYMVIQMDRPFDIGDWIKSPDRDIEGTVEEITWRMTKLRTFERRPLYVPNSVFSSICIENPSRMSHRRIKETIGVRYRDFKKMQVIVDDIKRMLIEHAEIDENEIMIVNFNQFSAYSCDILIYTFTYTTVWMEFHAVKQDVLLKIGAIISKHGGEIAFPTRTVHTYGHPIEELQQ